MIPGPVCDWSDYSFFDAATVESVRGCIEAGTPLDSRNEYGDPPLHRLGVGFRGDATIAMVRLFLEAGADVNERTEHGSTPLHSAANTPPAGNAVASALLERGADVNARNDLGRTPLHSAAASWSNDNDAMVSLLVRAGADVNARTGRGETPLHLAVREENPAVTTRLLELGADPAARTDSGMVADPFSCEHWNTPVFFALADAEQVSGCIAAGSDVHARTERSRAVEDGSTPLHMAFVVASDTAVIPVLLRAGADIHARDSDNYQPIHRAAQHRSAAMVRMLLQAGAEVDARAKGYHIHYGWDWTPLHMAAADNADPEVTAVLLEAGADLHARGYEGETPLSQAAGNDNPAVAALLLEAGADVHAAGRRDGRCCTRRSAGPRTRLCSPSCWTREPNWRHVQSFRTRTGRTGTGRPCSKRPG
ncbi:MAG: ankyrin repeat domain-containing protein [Gemmatimonadota bacterium]|nr:ankyrin repeat domain-containing protein [Gemmatimonadota bacterium]MDE2984205.1 ankyrin repeat domain-containing protein [Gemmatimonadota bacterium]